MLPPPDITAHPGQHGIMKDMSNPDTMPHIAQYCNPAYWDGHTLGVGEVQERLPSVASHEINGFVRQALESTVRDPQPIPIETYKAGDTFNADTYRPGTIVLIGQEVLLGTPVDQDYDLDELSRQPLPPRPIETSPSFGSQAPFIIVSDTTRQYLSQVRWGVICETEDERLIASVAASAVTQDGRGARARGLPMRSPSPLTVGETEHTLSLSLSEARDDHQLRRSNIIHVMHLGASERARRKVFGFIGRAAFGRPTTS